MQKTKIEWTEMSWNPVTGCLNNCPYCYARAMYKRFGKSFKPLFHSDRLDAPIKEKKPKMIFVCSVADLFGEWVPSEWIKKVIEVIEETPQHTYQLLTKFPKRYSDWTWPKNAWLGATVTNQTMTDHSLFQLNFLQDENITFISCEPLLNPIRLNHAIDWLIIGACTGKMAMQPKKEWVYDLIQDANKFHIPVFMKNNLKWKNPLQEFPMEGER